MSSSNNLQARNPYRKRAKRCYELAFRYVLDHDDTWTIVHGMVSGHLNHAWLERDGFVFDLTRHNFPVPRVKYYETFHPTCVHRYSLREACEAMVRFEDSTGESIYGPWKQ